MSTTPRTGWILTKEALDELLAWLDPDRDQAARKYEDIRERLIRIFAYRGCPPAEDLADRTINKVARKVHDLKEYYVGDPVLYFLGVARNVYRRYLEELADFTELPEVLPAPPPEEEDDESESQHDCLDSCLQELTPRDRDLLLEYYREERGAKIQQHKETALKLGITVNALRIMIFRIRASFKKCMTNCMEPESA